MLPLRSRGSISSHWGSESPRSSTAEQHFEIRPDWDPSGGRFVTTPCGGSPRSIGSVADCGDSLGPRRRAHRITSTTRSSWQRWAFSSSFFCSRLGQWLPSFDGGMLSGAAWRSRLRWSRQSLGGSRRSAPLRLSSLSQWLRRPWRWRADLALAPNFGNRTLSSDVLAVVHS